MSDTITDCSIEIYAEPLKVNQYRVHISAFTKQKTLQSSYKTKSGTHLVKPTHYLI